MVLTRDVVERLGLDKVGVITSDMLAGYTIIGSCAFFCCSSLTSIKIPNSITIIGEGAFYKCSNLTSVTIPNSVTSIGNSAFAGCRSLTSVTIPNSVTNIESFAFYHCSGLIGELIIPNSVTSIGENAFQYCNGLTSIEIPNSVISIGNWAFSDCSSLTSVKIGDKIYNRQTVVNGKCKAYKGFNAKMICRNFRYKESKSYEIEGKPKLCEYGFHACLNLVDVFSYYCGKIGKNIIIHEVELEDVSDERQYDSKVVAKRITIGKRIL